MSYFLPNMKFIVLIFIVAHRRGDGNKERHG